MLHLSSVAKIFLPIVLVVGSAATATEIKMEIQPNTLRVGKGSYGLVLNFKTPDGSSGMSCGTFSSPHLALVDLDIGEQIIGAMNAQLCTQQTLEVSRKNSAGLAKSIIFSFRRTHQLEVTGIRAE